MSQPIWTPSKDSRRDLHAVEDLPREERNPVPGAAPAAPVPTAASPETGPATREQAYSMEAMSALAGGIAHVFNNFLTAIGFETELALSHLAAEDPARKHLREIEKVGERAADLARQLLAFSGSQVLHPRPVQLNQLLRDLSENLHRLLGEGIQLETDLDPDLDLVQADPEQIEQVVLSLASNARELMPEGGRFTLRTASVELAASDLVNPWRTAPGKFVLLEVSDNGPGMKEEVRRRIFEPFFTTKRGFEAAGLGLSTVYGVVNQSGGQILAESEPGKGSTFLIYLPVPAATATSAGESPSGAATPWETILLVEDEENVRKPQTEILAARGYRVLEAADAAQALALCRSHKGPIHLMVTDILMNGMSGVELAERLAFERPEMKVLFATGYPAGLAERATLTQEDAPLLKKPFTGRALVAKVREVLESGTNGTLEVESGGGDPESALTRARVAKLEEELALARRALRVSEERLRDLAEAQVVGRLAGGVVHSFNNLLTAMAFDTELALARLPEGDPSCHHLQAVQSAVERGGALVRQLLAFGRERKPQPRALELNRVIAEVGESVRQLLAERIELILDLTPGLPPVRMDAIQIEQVLLTLAANAWEAMAQGGRLRIATAAALPPETRVQLLVEDTGRGMDEVALAHLFEPLYSNWEEGGLGLGLAWARGVLEQAGGRIDVESRPGEGSTFRILLPTVESTGAATGASSAISGSSAISAISASSGSRTTADLADAFGAETILLVEDEGDLRRPLAEILENRGYLVLSAASGAEAMDLAKRHAGPIHLLVTDVVMPGMSGQELARLLTPLRTETRVIFTTGYPEDVVAEESLLGDGPYHFLKKPFSSQALMLLMQDVLRE